MADEKDFELEQVTAVDADYSEEHEWMVLIRLALLSRKVSSCSIRIAYLSN